MAKFISSCPVCGGGLNAPVLKCKGCGLELKKDFEFSPFDRLSEEQYDFLLTFLKHQGNLKALQAQKNLSYPAAKGKLRDLLCVLGLDDATRGEDQILSDMEDWDMKTDSTRASDIVKAKLVSCGGRATVHTLDGKAYSVWVEGPDSFACDKINSNFTYKIFDVIVEHMISYGGKAKKGDGHKPIGNPRCGEDTIAAAIAKNYWGRDIYLDPGYVMFAILEWAGIIHNRRGYTELTAEYRAIREL